MNYITQNQGPNRAQRNAAAYGDKTSGVPDKTRGGRRMRARAVKRLDQNFAYRDKIFRLYRRAGITLQI